MTLHSHPVVLAIAPSTAENADKLTPLTFWKRLLSRPSVRAQNLGAGGIEVTIKNPGQFLDMRTLLADCLLKGNADRCPGMSGTVVHFFDAERQELKIDSHLVPDMQKLAFRHRLDDLVPTN